MGDDDSSNYGCVDVADYGFVIEVHSSIIAMRVGSLSPASRRHGEKSVRGGLLEEGYGIFSLRKAGYQLLGQARLETVYAQISRISRITLVEHGYRS